MKSILVKDLQFAIFAILSINLVNAQLSIKELQECAIE